MNAFTEAYKLVLGFEGGLNRSPVDPAAKHAYANRAHTKWGITQETYNLYRTDKQQAPQTVEMMNESEAQNIYRRLYWEAGNCDSMPAPLSVIHFDNCVQFGVSGAVRFLQSVLPDCEVDGIFGPITERKLSEATNRSSDILYLCHQLIQLRLEYRAERVIENQSQLTFLVGWIRRDAKLSSYIYKNQGHNFRRQLWTGPIIPNGYFSWEEVTHNGSRIPDNGQKMKAIELAQRLQPYRERLGLPMHISSWLRTKKGNAAVGGAENSMHLTGGAVDTIVVGMNPRQLAAHFEDWAGGLGVYDGHIHLDIGKKRRW